MAGRSKVLEKLAAALIMAAGLGCAGSSQQQSTASPESGKAAATASSGGSNSPSASAAVAKTAPAAKTAAADDELDIAIRDASDYLNDNIPKESKIVILNIESNSANLSEYIIDELIANAVNDKNFSVVDRRQLEAIQSEQKFQMSGAVDDKDALAIGKFFGAQTIISGAMREIGARYRLTIRALSVQTAQVQGQYNRNMSISETLTDLANSGGSRPASGAVTTNAKATQTATTPATATASPATPAAPPIQGTMVPGESLTEKLAWLTRAADSHNTYIVEVNADESIAPYKFEYRGAINITIVLRGDDENRTIRLQSNGTMFQVFKNVTFILDNNVTLQGHSGNSSSMVRVEGGTFRMNNGATITGNETDNLGGGVFVESGVFEMNGGTISANTGRLGGGVRVESYGSFTMRGGIITGNSARGRVLRGFGGGTGGGVFVQSSGVIRGTFTKTGGTITGYNSDQANGNAARDEDGNILARKGHAVWVSEKTRKETTAGPKDNLSYGGTKVGTGAWDQ